MAEPLRIHRDLVESSSLSSVGYDPHRHIMAIEFSNGSIFHYADVFPDVMQEFYAAESKGRFYMEVIKGNYPGDKMSGRCPTCRTHGWLGDPCDCGKEFLEEPRKESVAPKRRRCDHEFADSKRCVKCGWAPI